MCNLWHSLRCFFCVAEGPVATVTALLCNIERNALEAWHVGLHIGCLLPRLGQHLTFPGPHIHNHRDLDI